MHDLTLGEHDMLAFLKPDTLIGASVYLILFVLAAVLLARALRITVHAAMTRQGHIDRTTVSFVQQFGSALIWVLMLILYAHLIPVLRSMGTALLAGASIASVVIGLAAQSTLGNLVAGISITIYRPFRLGDTIQVTAPTGVEVGVVDMISLGYTTLRTPDGRMVVLPNAVAASQVTVNLNNTPFRPWPFAIDIHVNRDTNLDSACRTAVDVAAGALGRDAVAGCFISKLEATGAVLTLRLQAPDAVSRDSLRSELIPKLAGALSAGQPQAERPTLS